jgi:hypothetical protein
MLRWRPLLTGLIVMGAWATSSCSPADFQSDAVIDTVRILASRASEPRARPGDAVTLEILAIDGRSHPAEPMQTFWLPVLCLNPANDAYYACFASLAKGGGDAGVVFGESAEAGVIGDADAGASAGPPPDLAGVLHPGMDLTPLLVKGSSLRFTVPTGAIIPRKGIQTSYGLVIAFNFACGGKTVELLPFDPGNPQQIPIGCFDANHNQLGPDDFVFGFTRVYVYDKPNEENPQIQWVDTGNTSHNADAGLAVDAGVSAPYAIRLCDSPDGGGCPENAIGPFVPSPMPTSNQVWADFYSTVGSFDSTARLLYDPAHKLSIPSDTDNRYVAPNHLDDPNEADHIWIVVHDNQGGADWVTVPLKFLAPDGGPLLSPDGGSP